MPIKGLFVLICLTLNACASYSPTARRDYAENLAHTKQWQRQIIPTSTFDLLAYVPAHATRNKTLTIYIEGDGLAWLTRQQRSTDPTPKVPVGLQLALQHSTGNAVYLARPCQYVTGRQTRNCDKEYWSSHRFAPEVIAATDEAITDLRNQQHARSLVLVGYSGGGAVAALVAARRSDVTQLITVAGNLDHLAWTQLHQISPLAGSLNPADVWLSLVNVPQTHFVGSKDQVITPAIVRAYQQRFPADTQPLIKVIDGFDHRCCWARDWPQLLTTTSPSGQ